MKTQTIIIWVIILGILLWGISYLKKPAINIQTEAPQSLGLQTYTNDKYGFTFKYPVNYKLTESEVSNSERFHYRINLVDKNFVGGNATEGPTMISIDIYQNNLDKQTLQNWIKNTSESNFKLSNGDLATTTIMGISGLSYDWDGLYRGKTTVFEYNQNIFAISGTYLDTKDPIVKDYQNIINSLESIPTSTSGKLPQTLVENYLKENISKLSSEKEVLGGKFYITHVTLDYGGRGTVNYEDGHNAFVADFKYGLDKAGNIFISDFIVKK